MNRRPHWGWIRQDVPWLAGPKWAVILHGQQTHPGGSQRARLQAEELLLSIEALPADATFDDQVNALRSSQVGIDRLLTLLFSHRSPAWMASVMPA